AVAESGLHFGGGIVDAGILEFGEARNIEPPIFDTARHDHAASADPRSILEIDDVNAGFDPQAGCLAGNGDTGAEFLGLEQRVARELGPGDAHRKPKVVLDAGARARLAAARDALDGEDVESLGGC